MVGLFLTVTSSFFVRSNRDGLQLPDFRDAIYYPVVSLLDGHNPYDTASYYRTYPVQQEFPPYLPVIMTLHLPLGLLSFENAQLVYYMITLVLTLGLACIALMVCGISVTPTRVLGLGTLLLLSRPGYWNLALGQCTVPVVIGTCLVLWKPREHKWVAALGLALALMKPTYGVPLALLLLAQGSVRVTVTGGLIAALLSAGPTAALIHSPGGISAFIASLSESHASFAANPNSGAISSDHRIDAVALTARMLGRVPSSAEELLISLTILSVAALAVWHLADRSDIVARTVSRSIACLAILTCTYHQTYDLLLLTLPLVPLATGHWEPPLRLRWVLLALLTIPVANHLAAPTAMDLLHIDGPWRAALTSINGTALIAAFCIYLVIVARKKDVHKPAKNERPNRAKNRLGC